MTLKDKYNKKIIPELKERFNYKNNLECPKLVKAVINVGLGSGLKDTKYIESVEKNLMAITGQMPIKNKAKKSISGFKIREGMTVGMSVTIRNDRMYDFVNKLINIVLPRIRDFRGISSKSIDENGNLTIGIKEHIVFLEIEMENVEKLHGLEISISTTAKNREEGLELFKLLGFPFKK
ncbi:MAG: 50S ribosomal protein L5 [Xanthomonadaceae bacterium]|nr:50S ribosomal protein L5 [Rhodospirillaceae bacterium]NIA17826.1 50S ribosomal protein L5 [Xanthomonadaceae bacterium]